MDDHKSHFSRATRAFGEKHSEQILLAPLPAPLTKCASSCVLFVFVLPSLYIFAFFPGLRARSLLLLSYVCLHDIRYLMPPDVAHHAAFQVQFDAGMRREKPLRIQAKIAAGQGDKLIAREWRDLIV